MEISPDTYFNGPLLKENTILYRQYQLDIVNKCKDKNSLWKEWALSKNHNGICT